MQNPQIYKMKLTFKVFELGEADDWKKTTSDFDYGQLVMKESSDTGRTWHWIVIYDDGRLVTEWEYDKEINDYISEHIPCIINYKVVCQAAFDRGESCECKLAREYDDEFTWISDNEFDLVCKARRALVYDSGLDSDSEAPNKRKRCD